MMPLRSFGACLREGTARRQSPDKLRARSLVREAEESYGVLLAFAEKMEVTDAHANYLIKNAYDILMELVRAKMLADGFSATGKAPMRLKCPTLP
ncbi:MAG: hypothetical protein HY520_03340 [Candidatus Aenigmarchaeota archaeon]|nr:hypothetical protein [Candidatus Aenigmarchaeota archaeon]